jgi:hypothetical protein
VRKTNLIPYLGRQVVFSTVEANNHTYVHIDLASALHCVEENGTRVLRLVFTYAAVNILP